MRFYGREEEIRLLRKELDLAMRNKAGRLAVVCGRRRIGKTALILKAFESASCPVIYLFAGKRTQESELIASWTETLGEALPLPCKPAFANINEILEFLLKASAKSPLVVVIDECQELERSVNAFWSRLRESWDRFHRESELVLVMSGSSADALRRIFCDASEPLYGRTDLLLEIEPFDNALLTAIARHEFPGIPREDLLTLYALTGGIPRYVEFFVDNGVGNTNDMINMVFSPEGAWFREEGNVLLANEFRMESPVYQSILTAVARGANEWCAISGKTGRADVTVYLSRLENIFKLIEKRAPLNGRLAGKGVRYYLSDPFFKFWYRFVNPLDQRSLAARAQWQRLQDYCRENWPTYTGRTLEDWFLARYRSDRQWDQVGPWWDRRGENEIDLVAVSHSSKKLVFAEVKRNPERLDMHALHVKGEAFLKANGALAGYTQEYRGLSLEDL